MSSDAGLVILFWPLDKHLFKIQKYVREVVMFRGNIILMKYIKNYIPISENMVTTIIFFSCVIGPNWVRETNLERYF